MPTYTGDMIRKFRTEKGLTQKELGTLCGMADSAIRRYESGRATPKLETVQKIADALEISVSNLLSFPLLSNSSQDDIKEWVSSMGDTKSDEINELFEALNEAGQDRAIEQVRLITMIPEYQAKIQKSKEHHYKLDSEGFHDTE